jgi:hypothetical protein
MFEVESSISSSSSKVWHTGGQVVVYFIVQRQRQELLLLQWRIDLPTTLVWPGFFAQLKPRCSVGFLLTWRWMNWIAVTTSF